MQNIVVIFGGQSPEHDISILTGLHLAQHITEDYRVQLVYLTKDNRFVCGSPHIDDYISGKAARAKLFKAWPKVACVVNCCHGGIGEDGTLAAFMHVLNIPITSCNPITAWRLQSKIATRQALTAAGFRQPKFQVVTTLDMATIKLPLPLIVKPDMLGSSIGITVAKTPEELFEAVKTALQMGERAIVEEYLADKQEVNVAVMKHQGRIITSALELINGSDFFSFAEKYHNPDSGFIKKSQTDNAASEYLAKIAPQVKHLAVQAYQLFGANGIVRVDFIIKGEQIILNEINTVPGFMAYHLWLKAHLPYGVVIDSLLKETLANQTKQKFITDFPSDVLVKNRQLVLEH